MDRATCESCPFTHPAPRTEDPDLLECRQDSPAVDEFRRTAVWPIVKPTYWCAKHPEFAPGAAAATPANLEVLNGNQARRRAATR